MVRLRAEIPGSAFTATILGAEREGSGVAIDDEGLVLTIGYLIAEASRVTLTLEGGETVDAAPIAYDHETGFGMVRAMAPLGARPMPLGASARVREGDRVVVAAFGGYDHAVDGKVVSKREFAGSWEYLLDEAIYTAPVHPYWGGAALIDRAGALVGAGSLYVEEAAAGGTRRPGNMFVPIDLLQPIRDSMIRTGRADRARLPWLGMYTAEAARRLVVTGVAPNAPADQAGVEPGDVILNAAGVAVEGLAQLYRTLWRAARPGEEIRFTLLRDDDVVTLRIRSGDRYDYFDLPRRH